MARPTTSSPLNNPRHSTLHNFHINVKMFGAVGDGTTNDTSAIQAAIDALSNTGGILFFPQGTYLVTSKLILPDLTVADGTAIHVLGYGATLKATTAISILGRRDPVDINDAAAMTNYRFTIEGLCFLGNDTAGQIGLDMTSTFGLHVKNCYASDLDTGYRITYGLMTKFETCFGKSNVSYSWHIRSGAGVISGATSSNSGSNHTVFYSCRDHGTTGQLAQWFIRESSGVVLQDCIAEGGNPVNAIDVSTSSTVARDFVVRGFHHENVPSGAMARVVFSAATSEAVFEKIWTAGSGVKIDASGCFDQCLIRVKDWPFMPAGEVFKHHASSTFGYAWSFEFADGATGGFNPRSSSVWVGGIVPDYLEYKKWAAFGGSPATEIRGFNSVLALANNYVNISPTTAGYTEFQANTISYRNATDANASFVINRNAATGLQFGAGGATALDTNLYREAADILKTDDRFKAVGGVDTRVVATASLPAAAAAMDGHILIEDAGAGDRNIIIYAGGQRFRVDGGANF